jgi:CTP synthase
VIITRSDHEVTDDLIAKIALFCDVEERAVIPMVTASNLYEIPLQMEEHGVGEYLLERMGLAARREPEWEAWESLVTEIQRSRPMVKIALVGKYVELHDAYFSVREALEHASLALGVDVKISWVHSSDLEKGRNVEIVQDADGILVPGGFGSRGTEGKIQAIRHSRETKTPYLGLCLGMQLMVVELARHLIDSDQPNSTEFNRGTPYPVIDLMPDQRDIADMGGTMRLGLYPCQLQPGTIAAQAYKTDKVEERHRHRFELNNAYRDLLAEGGMLFSGISPDGRLVEIVELADHPFMLATQFHPEFLSRPNRSHPLFLSFVRAAAEQAGVLDLQ